MLRGMEILDSDDLDLPTMDLFLLQEDGAMRLRYAPELELFKLTHLRLWAQARGRYLLPTQELIFGLNMLMMRETLTDPSSILEIGAGMGDLGKALGIRSTDSGIQQREDMKRLYKAMGCEVTKPAARVQKLDAIAAAKKYKPHTIVASWVTQAWREGDTEKGIGACMFGPDEGHLLNLCKRYIFIGNEATHGDKRILAMPHKTYRFGGHVSRAADQSKNVVWVWER